MSNPFDHVVGGEKEEIHIEKPKDELQISFRLNKTNLERGGFIVVILALGIFLFWNPFCDDCLAKDDLNSMTGNAVLGAQENKTEVVVKTEIASKEDIVEEENIPEVKDEETDVDGTYDTNFAFAVTDIDFDESDSKPVKMNSITFVMYNKWKDLRPRVIVRWYDDESSEAIREKKRTVLTLKEIEKGSKQTITVDQFDSRYFDPQMDEEIISLDLYDRDTNELLESIQEIIG